MLLVKNDESLGPRADFAYLLDEVRTERLLTKPRAVPVHDDRNGSPRARGDASHDRRDEPRVMAVNHVRIELLDRRGEDIPDPFGSNEACYTRCASKIYSNTIETIETL